MRVKHVILAVFALVISFFILGILLPTVVYAFISRSDDKKYNRQLFVLNNYTTPQCVHFPEAKATVQWQLHKYDGIINVGVYFWYSTRHFKVSTLPVMKRIVVGMYNEGQMESGNFFYVNSENRTDFGEAFVQYGNDSVPVITDVTESLAVFDPYTQDSDNFDMLSNFFVLYDAALQVDSDQKVNMLLMYQDTKYEVVHNVSLWNGPNRCQLRLSFDDNELEIGAYYTSVLMNIVTTLILLVLGILFTIFYKVQPVRSRLPLLPISTAALLLMYFIQQFPVIVSFAHLHNEDFGAALKSFRGVNTMTMLIKVFTVFSLLTYCFHILRYFYIKFLYGKLSVREDISKNRFTIHRQLTSNIAFFIYCAVLTALVLILFLPIQKKANDLFVAEAYAKMYALNFAFDLLNELVNLLVWTATTVGLVVEIVTNFNSIKEKGKDAFEWFFHSSDPLYFRVEMLCFFLPSSLLTYYFCLRCYRLRLLGKFDPFSSAMAQYAAAEYISYAIIKCFVTWFVCGGMTFIIQFYLLLRRGWFKKYRGQNELEKILLDPEGYRVMNMYCAQEWSSENLHCWKYLNDFKNKGTISGSDLLEIYFMFILPKSEMEVNVPYNIRKAIMDRLGPKGQNIEPVVQFDAIYDQLLNEVCVNLADTLGRFSDTVEYHRYVERKKALNVYRD